MKTAEVKNIIEGIIDSFQGAILTNRQADAINDAREFLAASHPPAAPVSGDELTEEMIEQVGFTKHTMIGTGYNSISSMTDAVYYYKYGRITINATTFWTWFLDNEIRNDIAVTNIKDLVLLILKYPPSATLPTREQRGEKEKFAIRFSEWLMIQCEYKNHCVWEYRGEEYTQNELIEIFKRTTPLPSPPKH